MTITYARAQAAVASGDNADPANASFGSAVTAGNLLVVSATERSAGSADNFVITDNGSNTGWTKRVNETTLQGDTNARRTHVVWTRVATSTDAAASPFTVSVDDGTANGKMAQACEYTAGATVTWAFEAVVAANTGTGSTSPLASGSTASVSGTLLLIGNAIWRLGTGGQSAIAFSGLNGVASAIGANNGRSLASAWAQDATTGTKSTSVSWTGTGHEGNVALLVFSAVEPGGDTPEVTASIPLALSVGADTEGEHAATAAIPLALGVGATAHADHAATAGISLALAVSPVTDAPTVGAAEVTAAIPLSLSVTAEATATHSVTAAVPLALTVSPITDAPTVGAAEVTAIIPLNLIVGGTTATEHAVSAAIPLTLNVAAVATDPTEPPPSFVGIVVGPLRDPLELGEMRDPLTTGEIDLDPATVGAITDLTPTVGELRDTGPAAGELRDLLLVDTMRDPLTIDELED